MSLERLVPMIVVVLLVASVGCGSDEGASPMTTAPGTSIDGDGDSGGPNPDSSTYEPVFAVVDCPVPVAEDLDVECGTVTVPENRDQPSGGTVELAVARVRSPSAEGNTNPVVRLTGGPGFPAIRALRIPTDQGGVGSNPLLLDHDLIYVDQRGTGFSTPSLDCPERDEAIWSTLAVADSFEIENRVVLDSLASCRERLAGEGIDLAAYDTVTNAADIDDVRMALGVDEWTLWGTSYGALLALEVMRSHPDGVRAVVLDSVVPPDDDGVDRRVRTTNRAFDVLVAACDESEACRAGHPDLRSQLRSTFQSYDDDPFPATIEDPDGTPRNLLITGDELLAGLFSMMYDTDQLAVATRRHRADGHTQPRHPGRI